MNQRKKLLFLYSFILSIFLSMFGLVYFFKKQNPKTDFRLSDQVLFVKSNYIINAPNLENKLIIFLSLDCEYCIAAVKVVEDNIARLQSKYSITFIYSETRDEVKNYISNIPKLSTGNIAVYHDSTRVLFNQFKVKSYPTIFEMKKDFVIMSGNAEVILNDILSR